MEMQKENQTSIFSELGIGNSVESFQKLLQSQQELFHNQIDQLQNIVVTQCTLTGVNPLAQEMAAGALSIKIGKRPRDLLNPKAVKYMQSVFSIKDTISKTECREISALCGVTVTQVREFFAGQRSRVRKFVRLSREKAIKSNASNISQDGPPTSSDLVMPINQVPLNTVDPNTVEGVPSCSSQEETGIDDSDKNFLENIFNLMRKEETFSGQVKLLEWILQIQNSSVLHRFLTKGGVMIIATWLSQAALDEQTTVLLVILKVLCHLPLHKALPIQMSAILQTVNRLRFYRTSDISNRARILLSRWSKLFVRSQALKKPVSTNTIGDAQKEIIWNQRFGEKLGNESWPSNIEIPEEILALTLDSSENFRKSEPSRTLKLLPASADDSNRKHIRGVASPQTKERRKVQLMEQPGQKMAGRSSQGARMVPANQGRPMSADDIQKAKMRALFMQSKYGKTLSSNENCLQKTLDPNKHPASQTSNLLSASKTFVRPKIEEKAEPAELASKTSLSPLKDLIDPEPISDSQEQSWEKLKRDPIPWHTPPVMRINSLWKVAAGEKSKEVEVQTERIRREKETIYQGTHEIPSNPKEPWDLEMYYDDSLTPVIPTEQQIDADMVEASSSPRYNQNNADISSAAQAHISNGNAIESAHTSNWSTAEPVRINSSNTAEPIHISTLNTVEPVNISNSNAAEPVHTSNGNAAEPDLELLAVLLKNPELVFALTSAQGNNSFTSADTVRLLDMIKAKGLALPGVLNDLGGKGKEKMEMTSLPSPTPSNSIMGQWRPEIAKNSFSQLVSVAKRDSTPIPAVASTIQLPENLHSATLVGSQIPTNNFSLLQQFPTALHLQSSPQFQATVLPEKQLPAVIPSLQHPPSISQIQQNWAQEAVMPMKHFQTTSSPLQQGYLAASPLPLQPDLFSHMHNLKPAPVTIVLNTPNERSNITLPPLLPTPSRPRMQGSSSNTLPQTYPNNYNMFSGGSGQPRSLQGQPWERNEFVRDTELETWSPERSPARSPEYKSRRNYPEPRRDSGRSSRPDWSRQRNSGNRDHRHHANRRWRDRRH